jgi:23S rRNA (cytosine1962-C5)-methyltransferase
MPLMSTSKESPELTGLVPLFLKKGSERRLRNGHPWVFSNEIDIGRSPLRGLDPGSAVEVRHNNGHPLGTGYVNPATLISVRLFGREPGLTPDQAFLEARLVQARQHRDRYFKAPFYRLVYGESDGLPGLIVDRYGDVLVVQLTTAGMERLRDRVIDALRAVFTPKCIFLKNDIASRELEGLTLYTETVHGDLPSAIPYEENGARFEISPGAGQKTGWFFDHRANRARAMWEVKGKRVLDLFCYTGSWGIQAAVAGAKEVFSVDSSQPALDQVAHHAALNSVEERVHIERGDAFEVLRQLRAAGERFDVIIADPPAFIRRKKDSTSGYEAYRRLNGLAMQLLGSDGLLISASCSYHLSREKLVEILARVSGPLGRRAMIVAEGHQDLDHPMHPALLETNYLKTLFLRLSGEALEPPPTRSLHGDSHAGDLTPAAQAGGGQPDAPESP